MEKTRFFEPFIGSKYTEGIAGKKILVLGASFYCDRRDCAFFAECTDTQKKDSSPYDAICPAYRNLKQKLSEEPSACVTDWNATYQRFADYMGQFLGTDDYDAIWDHMAFTNYVQFFLPVEEGKSFRETRQSDLSARDLQAFNETLRELKPDIVVVWGTVISRQVMHQNEYLVGIEELAESNNYVCHLHMPGIGHSITLINPYHPSSSAWYGDLEQWDTYFRKILA